MGVRTTAARATAALGVAVLLASCSSGGDKGGEQPSGALEGRGEVTFATGKDTSGNMQKLVDEWNASHANEQVRIRLRAGQQHASPPYEPDKSTPQRDSGRTTARLSGDWGRE